MTAFTPVLDGSHKAMMAGYLDNLALVERLHLSLIHI